MWVIWGLGSFHQTVWKVSYIEIYDWRKKKVWFQYFRRSQNSREKKQFQILSITYQNKNNGNHSTSPSIPIFPSPSLSPAAIKLLVSVTVSSLASGLKFCSNSLVKRWKYQLGLYHKTYLLLCLFNVSVASSRLIHFACHSQRNASPFILWPLPKAVRQHARIISKHYLLELLLFYESTLVLVQDCKDFLAISLGQAIQSYSLKESLVVEGARSYEGTQRKDEESKRSRQMREWEVNQERKGSENEHGAEKSCRMYSFA